ncbi:MAG: hypothetical protein LBO08_01340 [Rickettsiales bacterium]|jgi:hypothetical protein|nr:hypothetical protein [Rickettsiales bacterium]
MEVPKKFQNEDGSLNNEMLIKSYAELEKKLGARTADIPEDPNEYPEHELFSSAELKQRFKDAGLSRAQAEKIYEIANEFLQPVLENIFSTQYESENFAELKKFFGGEDKMNDAMREINSFGEKFLPGDVYENLSRSAEGIKSVFAMMRSSEPKIETASNTAESLNDAALRKMMADPKYWRDRDGEHIRKIESGFRKLYS